METTKSDDEAQHRRARRRRRRKTITTDDAIELFNQLAMYIGKKDFKHNFWKTKVWKINFLGFHFS